MIVLNCPILFEDYEQRVNVVDIYFNGYSKPTMSRDIALLKVYPPLTFDSKRVSPICLPEPGMFFDSRGMLTW